jgi:hypothetical protein
MVLRIEEGGINWTKKFIITSAPLGFSLQKEKHLKLGKPIT